MDLDTILKSLEEKKVELDIAERKTFQDNVKLRKISRQLKSFEKAQAFLIEVAKESQEVALNFIEKITTQCIRLYGDHWGFYIEVKQLRDQQEFHFHIKEGEIDHLVRDETLAGGIIDLMALGLRIAIHALDPESEPILFLDEPFKNLGSKSDEAGELVKELSRTLKLQIVIITHDENLMAIADTTVKME